MLLAFILERVEVIKHGRNPRLCWKESQDQ